jgi:hypothetical protein
VFGPGVKDASGALSGNDHGEHVVDGDVDLYADSVKEYSSAAVASRDSSSAPARDSLISCTPTVQPER